jgi:hypothetical protein
MEKDILRSFIEKVCHDFAGVLNYFTMADLDQKSDLQLLSYGIQKGAWLLEGYRFLIAGRNISHNSLKQWIESFEKITQSECSFSELDLEKVSLLLVASLMILQESLKKGSKIIFKTNASYFNAIFKDCSLRNVYIEYFKDQKNPEKVPLLSILHYMKCSKEDPVYQINPSSIRWTL